MDTIKLRADMNQTVLETIDFYYDQEWVQYNDPFCDSFNGYGNFSCDKCPMNRHLPSFLRCTDFDVEEYLDIMISAMQNYRI